MSIQDCTTTKDGIERTGKRWGDDGYCYMCTPEGECGAATERAWVAGEKATGQPREKLVNAIVETVQNQRAKSPDPDVKATAALIADEPVPAPTPTQIQPFASPEQPCATSALTGSATLPEDTMTKRVEAQTATTEAQTAKTSQPAEAPPESLVVAPAQESPQTGKERFSSVEAHRARYPRHEE